MKKIKELLKRLETWFLKKPWTFAKLTAQRDYLTTVLNDIELYHIRVEVENLIESWPTDEISTNSKMIVTTLMKNVLDQAAREMGSTNSSLPRRHLILLNLAVSKELVITLTKIIGVQPMTAPLATLFSLKNKQVDSTSENGGRSSFEIISTAVEAASRRLATGYTIEAMRDMQGVFGIDIESELRKAVASEVNLEMFSEVIKDLLRLGITTDISGLKIVEGWETDAAANALRLETKMKECATDIALKTNRGRGNFAIIPAHILSILQSSTSAYFKASGSTNVGNSNNLIHCGVLDGMQVYATMSLNDEIIIGYKGGPSETDAGYFMAPYVPLMQTGLTTNPVTFHPVMNFMTRYGKTINGSQKEASNYYRVLKLDPMV